MFAVNSWATIQWIGKYRRPPLLRPLCECLENTIDPSAGSEAPSPRTPTGTPIGRRWSSGSRSGSTALSSGSCAACSNAYCRRGPSPSGVLPPTDPVREHRRAEAATAPVDRGWERGDQRAGFALDGKGRCSLGHPHRRGRAMTAVSRRLKQYNLRG